MMPPCVGHNCYIEQRKARGFAAGQFKQGVTQQIGVISDGDFTPQAIRHVVHRRGRLPCAADA